MSFDVINVAIFPCEAENAFELGRSLKYAPRFKVIGLASAAIQSYFEFENVRDDLPFMNEEGFIEELCRILHEEKISYIFPSHESVALFLKEKEHCLPAKVLCSSVEISKLCRDKALFYEFIKEENFCPRLYAHVEEIDIFPVFLKPRAGQGGQGCLKVESQEVLVKILQDELCKSHTNDKLLMCEYLPEEEYTFDCFTNKEGKLLFCGARLRDVVKLGMSFVSKTIEFTEEMSYIANRLNNMLSAKGLRGLWFFQLKKDRHGKLKILEISTRVAGTMALYRQRGINFAQLSLYDALGFDVAILDNQNPMRLSRAIHACYETNIEYDIVFMDLDDTLIVRNKVNLLAIAFLYQCVNKEKKIILLTRHEGDIISYLEKFRIDATLFDGIFAIDNEMKKSTCIQNIQKKNTNRNRSIFIDNLFVERQEVHKNLGIPVFDVDAMESLLEEHL